MWLYGASIALSAFLLFEVQPIIAKIILPWFGGSAAVWTTALMFFQLTLLAGYLYAYCSITYLRPKAQAALHLLLLAASIAVLPIIPSQSWKPGSLDDPTARILLVLAASVGLPYFVLSTTGPLLQAWYAAVRPGSIPYRLFALSNAGSMLALISFPVLIEPVLPTRAQGLAWSAAYALFATLCAAVAFGAAKAHAPALQPVAADPPAERPAWRLLILWTALPACASALMMSVTTHLTQNIAPIPFLWVLTLALYLLSFILCFESDTAYKRAVYLPLAAGFLAAMAFAHYADDRNLSLRWAIPLFAAGLFICCMVCHGETARLKPHPRFLTSFYLSLALGGAVGGLFVAFAAPRIFSNYLELPIAIVACAVLIAIVWRRPVLAVFAAALAGFLVYSEIADNRKYLATVRNFYGVLRVSDQLDNDDETGLRTLINGTINHGSQLSAPARRREPTSYYSSNSGVGRALAMLRNRRTALRVGVIGLGAGVLASYCRAGDVFRFYEINPLDAEVANRYFTFLKDCPGDCQVLLGDARLALERQPSQQFDLLVIDAFSSDSIPVHLLTRQAFSLYIRHVKPDGIIAAHVSNRYLDLVPVVARDGEELRRPVLLLTDSGQDEDFLSKSDWMLLAADPHLFNNPAFHGTWVVYPKARPGLRTWTDDFSNLYQILK